jgi:hypothetical protein
MHRDLLSDVRGFPSLAEAIAWLAPRWQERPVPLHLHGRGIDGTFHSSRGEEDPSVTVWTAGSSVEGALGGPPFTPAFLRALSAGCDDRETVEMTEPCYHVGLRIGSDIRECVCFGTNWKKAYRERYRYPMWRAFQRLLNARNDMPRHPHPAERVLALAGANWDGPAAALRLERDWYVAEPLFLTAIRMLHGRYEEAPVGRVGWVSKSESQRMAEEAVA